MSRSGLALRSPGLNPFRSKGRQATHTTQPSTGPGSLREPVITETFVDMLTGDHYLRPLRAR